MDAKGATLGVEPESLGIPSPDPTPVSGFATWASPFMRPPTQPLCPGMPLASPFMQLRFPERVGILLQLEASLHPVKRKFDPVGTGGRPGFITCCARCTRIQVCLCTRVSDKELRFC